MFKRTHHQHIASVLEALNADLLLKLRCYFGGGTAIALCHGEYRESVDMDFMTSDATAHRELRTLAKGPFGAVHEFNANRIAISGIDQEIDGDRALVENSFQPSLSKFLEFKSPRIQN